MKGAVKRLGSALLAAVLITAAAALGLMDTPDATVSDALYQHRTPTDGQIVVVGMDQRAVDVLGPMPWSRTVMAYALAYLRTPTRREGPLPSAWTYSTWETARSPARTTH